MIKQINLVVEKYLKKKKEIVVIDLWIQNYYKKNFYIALVLNTKIDQYKMLYIPLDIVDGNRIDEYVCYQFVDLMTVNYLLPVLCDSKKIYSDDKFRNRINERINNYIIEINVNFNKENYKFLTTRFIPKDWDFMFDIVVTLFSYVPHIISGFSEDMLTLFKDSSESILYQESFEFDLLRDDSNILFRNINGNLLDFKKITYLEELNGKYFSIISNHIVIIDYDKYGIINTFCDCEDYYDYVCTVIEAIREGIFKPFTKIQVSDKNKKSVSQYYLCYGVSKKGIKVLHGCYEKLLPLSIHKDGLIKIISDDNKFEEAIEKIIV